MIENSRFRVWNSQRAADGEIAARTPELNGLMRAGRTAIKRLVIPDGNSACYKGSAYQQLYVEQKERSFLGGITKAKLLSRSG